jgi:hypothetical protein
MIQRQAVACVVSFHQLQVAKGKVCTRGLIDVLVRLLNCLQLVSSKISVHSHYAVT